MDRKKPKQVGGGTQAWARPQEKQAKLCHHRKKKHVPERLNPVTPAGETLAKHLKGRSAFLLQRTVERGKALKTPSKAKKKQIQTGGFLLTSKARKGGGRGGKILKLRETKPGGKKKSGLPECVTR